MKHIYLLFVLVVFGSLNHLSMASPEPSHSKDNLSIIYLGKGTKLVLKTNLEIPANAGRLKFPYPMPNQYNDACYLDLKTSIEDRHLSAGREIVLSGKVVTQKPTFISIGVERPQDIVQITCTDAWDGQISISKLKSAFFEYADLVFPESTELPE